LRDSFLNAVCNVHYTSELFLKVSGTKVKPVEAKTDHDDWEIHQFFRGPTIQFQNGDRRTDKRINNKKFGYRKPSWNEEEWHKTDPKKLDDLGFKKE
jgi:hypothetical protein